MGSVNITSSTPLTVRGSFAAQRDGEDLKRRRELLDKLRETARELRWLGASEEDILEAIGGDGHD